VGHKIFNIHNFIHLIHQCLYSPLLGSGLFFSFVIIFTQSLGLVGRVISPSQGRYLHTGQHDHRINAHKQRSMPGVGFESTIPAFERAEAVHALDRAATVISNIHNYFHPFKSIWLLLLLIPIPSILHQLYFCCLFFQSIF
jgi:hypothetical protein